MGRLPKAQSDRERAIHAAHAKATAADPVTAEEAKAWRLGLSMLDGARGARERLALCRELLRHAKEDRLLTSDEAIIIEAVRDLELELTHEVFEGPGVCRVERDAVSVCDDEDDSADSGYGSADTFLDDDDA